MQLKWQKGVQGVPQTLYFLVSNQGLKTCWRGVNDNPAPRWTVLKLLKNSKPSHCLEFLHYHDLVFVWLQHSQTLARVHDCRHPSLEEVLSWSRSFEMMLRSLEGREVFREFLCSEYSEDNLLFWLACEDLKKETNSAVVDEKARIIYEDYVSILSPKEVYFYRSELKLCHILESSKVTELDLVTKPPQVKWFFFLLKIILTPVDTFPPQGLSH